MTSLQTAGAFVWELHVLWSHILVYLMHPVLLRSAVPGEITHEMANNTERQPGETSVLVTKLLHTLISKYTVAQEQFYHTIM